MKFDINLDDLIGRTVRIETSDGVYRTGKVTSIEWHEMKLLGQSIKQPRRVVLSDASDYIDWSVIKLIA